MRDEASHVRRTGESGEPGELVRALARPEPTRAFRRRAWLEFQRALDPLAAPRPLPTGGRPLPPRAGG